MQIYPRSALDQHKRENDSEANSSNSESTKTPLFRVHSNGSPRISTSDWYDVETEKHEKPVE